MNIEDKLPIDDELDIYLYPNIWKVLLYTTKLLVEERVADAKEMAQDVVQDVLVIAWKHWEQIEDRHEPKALLRWLMTTTRRECFRILKKAAPVDDVSLDVVDAIMTSPDSFPGSDGHVDVLLLRSSIEQLPYPSNRIIIGMEFHEMTLDEMAKELQVTRKHMYKLRAAALKQLLTIFAVASRQEELISLPKRYQTFPQKLPDKFEPPLKEQVLPRELPSISKPIIRRGRKDKAISQNNSTSLGAQMRLARQERGISLTKMAELTRYTKSHLSNVENGIKVPSIRLVEAYQRELGIRFNAPENEASSTTEDTLTEPYQETKKAFTKLNWRKLAIHEKKDQTG